MTQSERITQRERDLDTLLAAIPSFEDCAKQASELGIAVKRLHDYLQSPEFREDFAASEAGVLPKDLKCGVLSEDGIYNALEAYQDAVHEITEHAPWKVIE